jgi:AAA15 family ATPase/GTPase
MLIKFSVANFKTFRNKAELVFIASNYDKTREEENLYPCDTFNHSILKSAVIYGANASGKSKLMEAFTFMRNFVLSSSRESQKGEPISVEPFLLNTETTNKPSEFEIIFIHKKQLFRYGFEVDKNKVISEWLFYRPLTKEIELFVRHGQQFVVHERKFAKGNKLAREKMIRENALMLSVAAQFNEEVAGSVIDWFKRFKIISALQPQGYKSYSLSSLKDNTKRLKILEMLQKADLNISDLYLEPVDAVNLPENLHGNLKNIVLKKIENEKTEFFALNTVHQVFDGNGNMANQVIFDMDNDESSGTNQFFALTGPIIDVIENGYVLAVDELDSKLHPNLVLKIIEIFNSKELNPKNAQLIFNTHDTNLLSADVFRRDQIWFVEKDRFGVSNLFSLSDIKEVRKEEDFENNYINGKYGAIPIISDFVNLHLAPA